MSTAWSHLPNTPHIDRIIADLRVNPNNWVQAWDRVYSVDRNAARNTTRDAALDAARNRADLAALGATWSAAWDAAWTVIRHTTRIAAFDSAGYAILALIAWPEAGNYLDLPVDQVQVLADLGDHKAILILPAVIVFESQRELVV